MLPSAFFLFACAFSMIDLGLALDSGIERCFGGHALGCHSSWAVLSRGGLRGESGMVILSVWRPLFSGCYGDTKCLSATFLRLLW